MGLFGGKITRAILGGISGGGLLSAGATLLGGVMQNKASAKAASVANDFTTEQLQNRHQWEVQDLLAAGLNPILSAGGTPSIGGSAVADVPSNPLGDASSKILQAKALQAQIANTEADTANKNTQTVLNQKTAARTDEETKLVKINQGIAASNSASAASQARIIASQVPNEIAINRNSAKEQNTWTNKYIRPHTKAWSDAIKDWSSILGTTGAAGGALAKQLVK